MGMPQQFRDSVCDSVIEELHLVLNRPGGLQNGFEQGICFILPGHVCQEGHGDANVEIQCIDCLQLANPEVIKVKYLLFARKYSSILHLEKYSLAIFITSSLPDMALLVTSIMGCSVIPYTSTR